MTRLLTTAIALAVGMGLTQNADAAVILDAAADTQLQNDSGASGSNFGADGSIEFRRLAGVRARMGLVRFDLSGVSGDLSGASLTFNVVSQPSSRTRTVGFYGIHDGAANENFNEATVTYQIAPGLAGPYDDGNIAFSGDATGPLTTATVNSGVLGDYTTAATTDLDNFLAADTNGVVTFAFLIDPISNGGALYLIDTKEGNGNSVRLNLPNAVPEPTSIALMSLGGLLFARRRRA